MKMAVIVTGGRNNNDVDYIRSVLDMFDGCKIYVGDCPTGVDKIVIDWAKSTKNHGIMYHADWRRFGKSAGPKRNLRMIESADKWAELHDVGVICLAFDGGAGTDNCIRTAQAHGIPVLRPQKPDRSRPI